MSTIETARRDVVVLGSTGSVGTQAVEVIAEHPHRFRAVALCAAGNDVATLAAQAALLEVPIVGIADPTKATELDQRCKETFAPHLVTPSIVTGGGAASELAELEADVVLNAIDGAQALRPTLTALDAGRVVALANKESLIAGGRLVTDRARPGQIVPVDSEHSALAQCLRGATDTEVARLILTASGGPFHGQSRADLISVTAQQTLAHPTWNMGRVITTNSATLMNKGLEIIEAHILFGLDYSRIDAVIHPESHVHSMVQFVDGSILAQLSPPDMRLPIALALDWPNRATGVIAPVDWDINHQWNFEPIDGHTFPAIALARRAGAAGGCTPAVLNAANEHLVAAFHQGRIGFLEIVDRVADTVDTWLDNHHTGPALENVDEINAAQKWAHTHIARLIN